MAAVTSFVSGLVLGLGLILSGMSNPANVLGFLDVFGRWNPSLAFVMLGAIAVGVVAFRLARTRNESLIGLPMMLTASGRIDQRLVVGALLFGAGWGIAGFCPGPAIVAISMGEAKAMIFVVAMLAGMGLFEGFEALRKQPQAHQEHPMS